MATIQDPTQDRTDNHEFSTIGMRRLLLKYGLPGALGMLMAGMQGIIDGFFIGRFVGSDALAAVSIAMPAYSAIIAVCVIVGVGAMTVMGMSQGSGDMSRANDALRSSTIFLVLFSVIASALLVVFADSILQLMGADATLIDQSVTYLSYLTPFFPAIALTFMGDYYLRALGRPLQGLFLIATTIVTNIMLDYLLIAHFDLGVRGAAFATGSSFLVTMLVTLYFMFQSKNELNLRKGTFRWRLLGRMAYNGSSEGVSELSGGYTQLVFNLAMMRYLGSDGVAAISAVNYIIVMVILVNVGISNGLVPVIAYAYGAQKFDRVKSVFTSNVLVSSSVGLAFGLSLFFASEHIIGLFFDGAESAVITVAQSGSKIIALSMMFTGINIAISNFFTAIGDAFSSVIVAALRGLIFITIGINTLPLLFDTNGIWMTIPFTEIATVIVACAMVWRHYKVTAG